MCVMNTSASTRNIDFSRYAERTKGFSSARDVVTGETMRTANSVQLNGSEMLVLELIK